MREADAEIVVDILDGCVNLAEFTVRSAQEKLGLTEAQIIACTQSLDKTKMRALFVRTQMTHTSDQTAQALQADLGAAISQCKK